MRSDDEHLTTQEALRLAFNLEVSKRTQKHLEDCSQCQKLLNATRLGIGDYFKEEVGK